MTAAQSLKIYEILGKHFNNTEDARVVVTEIEQIIETKITEKKDVLATKEDIFSIRTEMNGLFVAIAKSEAKLTVRMFYFWVGQVAVSGLLAYFFKAKG